MTYWAKSIASPPWKCSIFMTRTVAGRKRKSIWQTVFKRKRKGSQCILLASNIQKPLEIHLLVSGGDRSWQNVVMTCQEKVPFALSFAMEGKEGLSIGWLLKVSVHWETSCNNAARNSNHHSDDNGAGWCVSVEGTALSYFVLFLMQEALASKSKCNNKTEA